MFSHGKKNPRGRDGDHGVCEDRLAWFCDRTNEFALTDSQIELPFPMAVADVETSQKRMAAMITENTAPELEARTASQAAAEGRLPLLPKISSTPLVTLPQGSSAALYAGRATIHPEYAPLPLCYAQNIC